MKRVFLIVAMIAFVGVSIVSCKNEKKEHAEIAYACPMECEGDKTYADKNTKCPDCKMALVEKKSQESHKHDVDSKEHH
jgi:protein SCO1/2